MEHKKISEYDSLQLSEYNGQFEILAGRDKDNKFYPNWSIASQYDESVGGGVPATKDDGSFRVLPIKVKIGENAEAAIETLKFLLAQFGDTNKTEKTEKLPEVEDLPF